MQNFTTPVNVSAKGGKGGNPTCTSCSNPIVECVGPGGGGGGGIVWFSINNMLPNIATNVVGGNSGLYMHPSSTCYNTPYGAQPGNSGNELFGLVLPVGGYW